MKVSEEDKATFSNTCKKRNVCSVCGDIYMYLEEDYYAELGHKFDNKPIRALIYRCPKCKHVELFILD